LFNASPMVAAGFLIVAVCPGAPYAASFTALAKGNVATATGLMVILAASSAIAAPLLLRALLPLFAGDQGAQINAGRLVSTLVFASLAAGWIFGSARDSGRKTLAITTAVRNVGVALVIASGSFPGTAAVTATTAYGLFQTIAIALLAVGWGRLIATETALPKV